jgi:hypothetical protein
MFTNNICVKCCSQYNMYVTMINIDNDVILCCLELDVLFRAAQEEDFF